MCLGDFTGSDPVLNVTAIQKYIREEKVRFFQIHGDRKGSGPSNGNRELFGWVSVHCTAVFLTEWSDFAGGSADLTYTDNRNTPMSRTMAASNENTLYDCLGAAG